MTDSSTPAVMSLAAAQLAHLRLTAMTLAVLVQRGTLMPGQAAALVQNAAGFLEAEGGSPAVTAQFQQAFEQLQQEMLNTPRGSQR